MTTPDNPVTVRFYIKNKVYTVGNIVYPEGGSQLVWCKWHTPNTEQTVNIRVRVSGGATANKTNISASIVDLNKNPPPDPTADDRNDSFHAVSVPHKAQRTSASWSVWSCYWQPKWVWVSSWYWTGSRWVDHGRWVDKGEWKYRSSSYRASMTARMEITPDEKNPTATATTMKSGYGINEIVTASVSGNGEHTDLQNAVTYFPEFYYRTYWRLLESTSDNVLEFRKNKYSTYNNRTHFTPVGEKQTESAAVSDCEDDSEEAEEEIEEQESADFKDEDEESEDIDEEQDESEEQSRSESDDESEELDDEESENIDEEQDESEDQGMSMGM